MTIHENLRRIPKPQLREVGWSKAVELVKVVRRDGEDFDCATWLHKAKEMPKEGFKGEVERHLTGKETGPWKITSGVTVSARFANVETGFVRISTSSFTRASCLSSRKPLRRLPLCWAAISLAGTV
jgi:hypothetical protein